VPTGCQRGSLAGAVVEQHKRRHGEIKGARRASNRARSTIRACPTAGKRRRSGMAQASGYLMTPPVGRRHIRGEDQKDGLGLVRSQVALGEVHEREAGSPVDTVGLRCSPVAPEHRPARTSRVGCHGQDTRLAHVANSSQGFCDGRALPCEEFLYDLKRRLRAARKRAVLAADHRGTRVVRNPRLAAARPRQALPGRLPFPPWGMVRRRRVGGVVNYRESSAGHRPRAFPRRARDPAPRRGPADLRCPVEELARGPSPVEGRKRLVRPMGTSPISVSFFPLRPSTAAGPRAPESSVRRRCGDALRARPAPEEAPAPGWSGRAPLGLLRHGVAGDAS
jgi:hypothetical protein